MYTYILKAEYHSLTSHTLTHSFISKSQKRNTPIIVTFLDI